MGGGGSGAHDTLFDQGTWYPEEVPGGPSFTIDDVIEFHFLLKDDRYIQDFLASSGG